MRVLHIQRVSGIGGSERHLSMLLPALAERGLDVRMCVLATGDAARFVDPLATSVDTVVVPARGDADPAMVGRLAAQIRRFRPHLVHTHLIHADAHGQLAARLTRTPGISSAHSSYHPFQRQPVRTLLQVSGRMARVTIAISEHVASFLRELRITPPERIRVVHYGMDATGWRLADDERAAARGDLGLAPDTLAVGVASRLIPHKGHATLLAAVPAAVAGCPRLQVLVAGDGPLRPALEAQAAALPAGSVRFVGFVPDIRRFMNACDVIAFPTEPEFGEGFGMAALEAMASGRPLVATGVGPLPELVRHDETGIIVPPRSPDAVAAALCRLAESAELRERMGRAAAARAHECFGLARMVDGTIAAYQDACRSGGGVRNGPA